MSSARRIKWRRSPRGGLVADSGDLGGLAHGRALLSVVVAGGAVSAGWAPAWLVKQRRDPCWRGLEPPTKRGWRSVRQAKGALERLARARAQRLDRRRDWAGWRKIRERQRAVEAYLGRPAGKLRRGERRVA